MNTKKVEIIELTPAQEKGIEEMAEKRFPLKYHKGDPKRDAYIVSLRRSILTIQISDQPKKN